MSVSTSASRTGASTETKVVPESAASSVTVPPGSSRCIVNAASPTPSTGDVVSPDGPCELPAAAKSAALTPVSNRITTSSPPAVVS